MTGEPVPLSIEVLVAYVDGELPLDQAERVAASLSLDEAAQETVRQLRLSADMAGRAYADVADEPVPGHLLAAAGQARPEGRKPSVRKVPGWLTALAASLAALAIGLAGGYLLRGPGGGFVPAAAATADALTASYEATLQGALDNAKPGQVFAYESQGLGKGQITLGRDFKTASGVGCREFSRQETRGMVSKAERGIACQSGDGSWNVMTLAGAF